MDPQATIIPIPLDHLTISEHNARTIDRKPLDDLAASIAAEGLLQNLTVIAGEGDTYHVIAGKRRYGALVLLRERGELPPELEAPPCRIVDDERAISASLAENVMREAMHPADEFEAFQRLADAGRGVEAIAQEFGVEPITVKRRLRLANVAPSLFAKFRDDEIDLDQMMALTVTDDQAAQESAWNSAAGDWQRQPEQLRRRLTEREIRILGDRTARFVGLDAILAAGGTVRQDLFSDGDGYTSDRALIDRLATEKLQTLVPEVQAEGWAWVEVHAEANQPTEHGMRFAAFATGIRFRDDADAQEHAAATKRIDEIEKTCPVDDDDDAPPEIQSEYDQLQERIEEIEARSIETYSAADHARCGAVINIGYNNEADIDRGLVRTSDRKPVQASDPVAPDAASEQSAPKPAKPQLSQSMIARLAAHRTAAVQDALADKPHIAHAVLAFALLKGIDVRRPVLCTVSGIAFRGPQSSLDREAPDLASTPHRAQMQDDLKAMHKRLPKAGELLPWLIALDRADLDAMITLAIAQSIDTGSGEKLLPDAAQLIDALGVDMADYWRPTADGYFSHIPTALISDAVTDSCDKNAAKGLAGKKKADQSRAAEELLAGKRWLPKMLRAPAPKPKARAEKKSGRQRLN